MYCVANDYSLLFFLFPTRALKVPSAVIPSEPKITLTELEKELFLGTVVLLPFVLYREESSGRTKLMSCLTMLDTSSALIDRKSVV